MNSNPRPIGNTDSRSNPVLTSNPTFDNAIDVENEAITDPNADNNNVRGEQKFRLETALGRLQSYYSKANKYSGDFEEDLEDALAELNTACRGQLAPEEAKPELLRLAIQGRALTFYKSICATTLPWSVVQSKFRSQFMSRTKKAEIGAELDLLHVSSLRDEKDTDR